jgi:hypothetical protein
VKDERPVYEFLFKAADGKANVPLRNSGFFLRWVGEVAPSE